MRLKLRKDCSVEFLTKNFTQWSRQVPWEPSKGRLRRRSRSQNPSLKQAENPGTGWWDVIVQPDLSEFGSRNRTISRLQKEGPHIHSDNPSSVAILQVPTFSVRLHLYIYPTILHDPLCPKLFWGETSQHKPSPKIHPPTKNGMNNQQSNNLHQLSMGKKRRKKKHPSNLNHPLVCVCVCFTGETFALGSWYQGSERGGTLRCSQRSPFLTLFLRVGGGCPRARLKDAWGLGRLGGSCWLLVDGWVPKRVSFFGNASFLGGKQLQSS